MRRVAQRITFVLNLCFLSLCTAACAMLPGFGLLEDPSLYYIPVSEVSNQVACELQEFMKEQVKYNRNQRWVVANQDVSVNLNLQTDTSGYVNFTGVNVAQLGFSSLAAFISSTTSGKTSVPSLAIKGSAKRSRTVKINFTISPSALTTELDKSTGSGKTINCEEWEKIENPLMRLYLKDWLDNYFASINYGQSTFPYRTLGGPTDRFLTLSRTIHPPPKVPAQLKVASVELSTAVQLVVDISGGATPNLFGNGTAFIVPVNGLTLDYSPDYVHTIDLTIKICTNADPKNPTCYQNLPEPGLQGVDALMVAQCKEYAKLLPLLSSVTVNPPKDGLVKGQHYTCSQHGYYVPYQKPMM